MMCCERTKGKREIKKATEDGFAMQGKEKERKDQNIADTLIKEKAIPPRFFPGFQKIAFNRN
jgi:hypothetical protein